MPEVSVVVPVRNAERLIEDCLASIVACEPAEIIIIDGMSTDRTLELAKRFPVRILSDEGRGLPAARMQGAKEARCQRIALIDVDVVLQPGDLAALVDEFDEGGYGGLQAGLESTSGEGYWGRALAHHHRTGRSKHWFGLVATIFDRDEFLSFGLDESFLSGEDIELRWRLQREGRRSGVSTRTVVEHRFDDTFSFALGQWIADGRGLGRMLTKHRARGVRLALLPLAAGVRGVVLSLVRLQPRWIPYYLCFTAFNYAGMVGVAGEKLRRPSRETK